MNEFHIFHVLFTYLIVFCITHKRSVRCCNSHHGCIINSNLASTLATCRDTHLLPPPPQLPPHSPACPPLIPSLPPSLTVWSLILHTDKTSPSPTHLLNDLVVCQRDAVAVDLAVAALVDQLLDGLLVGVAPGNVGLNTLQQTQGGLSDLSLVRP